MPVAVSRDVTDAEVTAACLGDGLVGDCVQLEARSRTATVTTVHLRASIVYFSHDDATAIRHLRAPRSRWLFFVPLAPPHGVRWDGAPMTAETLIVSGPDSESVVFEPRGSECAVLSVSATGTPDVIEAARTALASVAGCGAIQAAPAPARALVDELLRVRAIAEGRTPVDSSELMRDGDATIRRRLCACLSTAIVSHAGDGSRSSIVRHAEQFLREHLSEAISIGQLSSVTGVSERSLRNAFYCVCTTGPKRYLRMLRLHAVRRSLGAATAGTATVTRVATQHGFYELGRFAGEYRALFGEAPSATLQRARLAGSET